MDGSLRGAIYEPAETSTPLCRFVSFCQKSDCERRVPGGEPFEKADGVVRAG